WTLGCGRGLSPLKPNCASKTYHCLYTTVLHCTSGVSCPGELRTYTPFNDEVILLEHTVDYVMAKAYFPPNVPDEKILLEVSHFPPC
ncbi:hypothetical protein EDD16DRAFT_1458908, partial [Pisolithus croceorrhizus]